MPTTVLCMKRFALVAETALHTCLPEQLSQVVFEKIDVVYSEMPETVEFGEQRDDLGDLPLAHGCGSILSKDAG